MDQTQATANDQSVQAIELTPEVISAVLLHTFATHKEVALTKDDIKEHIGNGGRALAAGHYAAEITRRETWARAHETLKAHVRDLTPPTDLAQRIAVAKLAGLLELVETGGLDLLDDEVRNQIIAEAIVLAELFPLSYVCAAWFALIELTCFLYWLADPDERIHAALDGARTITAAIYELSPTQADQLVTDLKELAKTEAKRHAS